jgi:sigma-B regulation protein RsbU (phosphoserine phosphatase)
VGQPSSISGLAAAWRARTLVASPTSSTLDNIEVIETEQDYFVNVPKRTEEARDRETSRLAALRRYNVAGLPPNGAFQDVVAIAARVFDAPIAIVSIVDHDRIFFPGRFGLDVDGVARQPGLCASAIMHDVPTVIGDARVDPVAMSHPLVAGAMGLRFYAGAPLRTSDGHNLGTVCVLDREPREVTPAQVAVLEHLAALVVHELELRRSTATVMELESEVRRRADDERDRMGKLVAVLQSALLPPELPHIPGIALAACYRPADRSVVGGDFYDVFRLQMGWGFVMGDVCGKGPEAATIAAAARHGLRVAAADHSRPAEALRVLNQALLFRSGPSRDPESFCTMVYGRLRRSANGYRATVSCGGHPHPLVLRANGRIQDLGTAGTLIGGLEEVTLTEQSTDLAPGDSIVMFSDGLSESRTEGGDYLERAGIRRLLENAHGLPASEILEHLDPLNHGAQQRDDLAILVARVNN